MEGGGGGSHDGSDDWRGTVGWCGGAGGEDNTGVGEGNCGFFF